MFYLRTLPFSVLYLYPRLWGPSSQSHWATSQLLTGLHWWRQPWGTMQSREWHIALMVWVDAVTQEQESCGVAGLSCNSDLKIPRTQLDCWMLVWVVQCWWFGIFSGQDIWYHLVCFGGLFLDKLSNSNWLQTPIVAKYDLEFQIPRYPPPNSWNYRYVSNTPSLCGTGDKTQGLTLCFLSYTSWYYGNVQDICL